MSLISATMEPCVMLNKAVLDDGYGGEYITWTVGASFNAAITYNSTIQARIGASQGTRDLYTVFTFKEKNLDYHDVFRRVSDNKIFRVTSDGDDQKTPKTADLNLRMVSAEEFVPVGAFVK